MRRVLAVGVVIGAVLGFVRLDAQRAANTKHPASGTVAFASFGPLNTDVFIGDRDGNGDRPLAAGPGLEYNASFSRDGRWVVFTSTRNGSADLYRIHPDGSGLERLTDDKAFDDQGALSPDGRTLAFVSTRSGQADIWTLDLPTGALRRLTTDPGGDFRPAWSPNGEWLAFSSDRESKKPIAGFTLLQSTEIFVVRADGSGLRRLTFGDAVAGSPSWSTDGQRVVYYEATFEDLRKIRSPIDERGTTQIVSVEIASGRREVLSHGPGEKWSPRVLADGDVRYVLRDPAGDRSLMSVSDGVRRNKLGVRNPAWSFDGQQMVFDREVETAWPPMRSVASLDASFQLRRTGIFPSYSSDGNRLVVNDARAGAFRNEILLMNADGTNRHVLFGDPERSALAPVWSPAGDRIAAGIGRFFQMTQGPATADIAIMTADGKDVRILTDGSTNYGFPSWSPDGNQVVFRVASRDRNGLLIADVATGAMRTLTSGHDNFPSWSPKGDRIAFTSNRDGDYEIYSIKTDGTDVRRLTHSPGNDGHNSWSPDGEWIAFTSTRRGFKDESALHPVNPQPNGDIHVMRADGSDVRLLTDDQFEDGTPGWVPLVK